RRRNREGRAGIDRNHPTTSQSRARNRIADGSGDFGRIKRVQNAEQAAMSERLNITVMLGGPSAEREVSLKSGAAVAKALRSLGHRIRELDPRDETWTLPAGTDMVFLALHGTYGEDGTVQGQLESLGVP